MFLFVVGCVLFSLERLWCTVLQMSLRDDRREFLEFLGNIFRCSFNKHLFLSWNSRFQWTPFWTLWFRFSVQINKYYLDLLSCLQVRRSACVCPVSQMRCSIEFTIIVFLQISQQFQRGTCQIWGSRFLEEILNVEIRRNQHVTCAEKCSCAMHNLSFIIVFIREKSHTFVNSVKRHLLRRVH